MEEEKKEVPGFDGYYLCDKKGNIYNKTGRMLKQFIGQGNYKRLKLKGHHYTAHRIIAQTFLPTPEPEKKFVDHINRNSLDNRLENLRWVTGNENNLNRNRQPKLLPQPIVAVSDGTTPRTDNTITW